MLLLEKGSWREGRVIDWQGLRNCSRRGIDARDFQLKLPISSGTHSPRRSACAASRWPSPPSASAGTTASSTPSRGSGCRRAPRNTRWAFLNAFFKNAFFENAFFENFANFWRARSRLYQNESLQENMRLTKSFQALQDAHTFAPLQTQHFSKNRFF